MAKLHDFYKDTVVAQLHKQFEYKSVMQVPRIEKITLNMGVGEAITDKKVLDHATNDLTAISGQKPMVTKRANLLPALRSVKAILLEQK